MDLQIIINRLEGIARDIEAMPKFKGQMQMVKKTDNRARDLKKYASKLNLPHLYLKESEEDLKKANKIVGDKHAAAANSQRGRTLPSVNR